MELDPKYVMAWRNLAMASSDLGQHRDAAAALETAARLAPNDADTWNRLGLAQLELRDLARAEPPSPRRSHSTPATPNAAAI